MTIWNRVQGLKKGLLIPFHATVEAKDHTTQK